MGDLIERLRAGHGRDRELDFLVWAKFNGLTEISFPTEGHPMTPGRGGRVEARDADGEWHLYAFVETPGRADRNFTPYGNYNRYPGYTASLDTAMTLPAVARDPKTALAVAYAELQLGATVEDLPRAIVAWALEQEMEKADG
jgi:hypothetical protein